MIKPSSLIAFIMLILRSCHHLCRADALEAMDFREMVTRCHKHCQKMYPSSLNTNVSSIEESTLMNDSNEIKLFTCYEGCRMAAIAYPKSEVDVQKFTSQK